MRNTKIDYFATMQDESILVFLIHSLIKLVLLGSIFLIFRKNADSANLFSKVGLLGAK